MEQIVTKILVQQVLFSLIIHLHVNHAIQTVKHVLILITV